MKYLMARLLPIITSLAGLVCVLLALGQARPVEALRLTTLRPSLNASSIRATGNYTVFLPLIARPSAAATAPIITSFTANPASVAPGGTSTLNWHVTGATSLSISPGVGTVTGSSVNVQPGTTTEYTLLATNGAGSASAKTTVTVTTGTPSSGGFFIPGIKDIDRPTSRPTVAVDSTGGVHIGFEADSTGQTGTHPAYYAYCPANCTSAAAFTVISLLDNVGFANLVLDPAGHPRMMVTVMPPTDSTYQFRYGTCDGGCTNPAHWTFVTVASATNVVTFHENSHYFALDPQGRPRFMYHDDGDGSATSHAGNYYAYCDAACTNAANWAETNLFDDPYAERFALAFSPTGQPRTAFGSYDSDNYLRFDAYGECNANCTTAANWTLLRLVDSVSASMEEPDTFALRVGTDGKPRMAFYPGTGAGGTLAPNYLYYLWCNAAPCTLSTNWQGLDLGLPWRNGEKGVDLVLDSQNRPRVAYHVPIATQPEDGLYYAWCNANCGSSQNWHIKLVETSVPPNQELPIPPYPGCPFPICNPPKPPCTVSVWFNGVRPSLALDAAGNPRFAYDTDHEQGLGCTTFNDTRLTRFALFNQP